MVGELLVGFENAGFVPALPVAALVTRHQQDGFPLRVEGEQDTDLGSPTEPGRSFFMFL
jgi:hypothetical protein